MEESLVVAVIGATGTGKSKLAIELAMKFNGEIISADSMQVYKGLDIITNKVTAEERKLAKHHILDYVDPLFTNYTIHDFKREALPVLDDIVRRKKLPIIVGGTNYYIESLLWNVLMPTDTTGSYVEEIENNKYRNEINNADLYKKLQEVDPEMANLIHPNDRRKILRCLQVYQQTGKPLTQLIEKQKSVKGGSSLGGPLRFKNSCIFWIQCEPEVLNDRLDSRVDEMIKNGLVEELNAFHQRYNKQRLQENTPADYTNGIFQSIGFKEFHDYLTLKLEELDNKGPGYLKKGVELLKQRTQRYAKTQQKWIRNRFLKYPDRQVPPIFPVDATDVSKWDENVLHPAVAILEALQNGETPPVEALKVENINHDKAGKHCDICNKIVMGEQQWNAHITSKIHKKLVAKEKKKNQNEQFQNSNTNSISWNETSVVQCPGSSSSKTTYKS
ncbi:tRNA dimethylallyltransferase [Chamberlinius hualienensis]